MTRTTTTVLVANRGEIAVRVLRAAREMGLRTALVAAADDAGSLAASLANVVLPLEGETLRETYLDPGRLIAAAKACGATLVHPGFGFLSENAEFARRVVAEGLVWVGPPAAAMDAVGSKLGAKRLAEKLAVPTAPWGLVETGTSARDLASVAARVGFPCLVKASAGGGGKGMKAVESERELAAAVESAGREALAAFGDGTLFIEKRVDAACHVEVQVFGDAAGEIHTFGERDCSAQRRHQKIIEETPSPAVTESVRRDLERHAASLARAVGYRSAGTVEFLFDPAHGAAFFLEVNARLQVEHGVTEERYGIDLVRLQLLTALGEKVDSIVRAAAPRGHAIEARLYAENPAAQFLPQPGRLERVAFPLAPGIRIDTGVRSGDVVTGKYDPMIAKVIAAGSDRAAAIARLSEALRSVEILGPTTNRDFLLAILADPAFAKGGVTTRWIGERFAAWKPDPPRDLLARAIAAALGAAPPAASGASAGTASSADGTFSEIRLGREFLS